MIKFSLKRLVLPGILLAMTVLYPEVRIKDIVAVENGRQESLVGYGLVVGLNGTGDRSSGDRGAIFTVQTISNMLERFGITVPKDQLRIRNVGAVMVTANTPVFGYEGSRFDVTVSSLGDATSLEGGVLLITHLYGGDGTYYAKCQGPVSIGGYNIETIAGEKLKKNHALVGRIPQGGVLDVALPNQSFDLNEPVRLRLIQPDFVTATRIAEEINLVRGTVNVEEDGLMNYNEIAQPLSASIIELYLPETIMSQKDVVQFIASIETLYVEPDIEARVVLNERTGTIVAGGKVTISEIMISHGSLTIHTMQTPIISQPNAPFSNTGRTVVVPYTFSEAFEAEAQTAVISTTTTVSDLAKALNELGLKPRDIIAIFQSVSQAGALNAKLIII